jgi:pSer/pThr/pTyr-binding forkhead associated (FHA) protein
MRACVLCREPASIGLLCTEHGSRLASPGVISDQILSAIAQPTASLIDAWGFPHPVASETIIGREAAGGLAILHPSISALHAALRAAGDAWAVDDRGSRNGTTVNGIAVATSTIAPGAMIGFGEVRFYFWTPALGSEARPTGRGRTAPTRTVQRSFAATVTTPHGRRVELRARADAGLAQIGDEVVPLARKEFALVQVLAERRAGADAEHAYVAWHEIAASLAFASAEADSENVRALVRRVRKKFDLLAPDEIIESKHGIGYRIAGTVTLAATPGG